MIKMISAMARTRGIIISSFRSLFLSDLCFVVVSMCSPVDWAVEEIPYSTEDLIVGVNDGFSGPEVDSGG